ncbi:MAG: hypothetical protein CMH22_16105 [Methylophaga sp.]|nr:hypothetical protein [Methylophaga sp.]MAX53500.1 hypothetical protein [Methylophaga sp.]|tara:strand:+ start:10816 stop:11031 length:216 start_codon:yes stop_codon:yes gene_type:complete
MSYSKRVKLVLERLSKIAGDEDEAESIAGPLDMMLDDLHEEDFFGTEGQCDPRGDFREEVWSIDRVQGVDD